MSKMNAVGWFEISVDDMARAVKFYETVFARKLENITDPTGEMEMMSFAAELGDTSAYGAAGALVKSPFNKPGEGGTMVHFSTPDCGVEEARVAGAGGEVLRPKFSIGEFGWVVICRDTEGNVFGIHSQAS